MKSHSFPIAFLFTVLLAGCGVRKEEHLRVVNELADTQMKLDVAESEISDLTTSLAEAKESIAGLQGTLQAEQEKSSGLEISLSEATMKVAELEAKLTTENITAMEAVIANMKIEKSAILNDWKKGLVVKRIGLRLPLFVVLCVSHDFPAGIRKRSRRPRRASGSTTPPSHRSVRLLIRPL